MDLMKLEPDAAPKVPQKSRAGMTGRRGRSRKHVLLSVAMAVIVVFVLFPFVWLLLSSLKPNSELFAQPPSIFPGDWTLQHYFELFNLTQFGRYFVNTLIVGIASVLIGISISVLGVYSVTRFGFIGQEHFSVMILFVYMLPPILLALPIFTIFFSLGLENTLLSLVLTYLMLTTPFSLWIIRPYIESIPRDLEDAAMVDGCTRFQAFRKAIVPQAMPGIVTAGVFTFIIVWNEYLYALVLISDEELRTLSLGVGSLLLETSVWSWGVINAAGVFTTIPVLLLFVFFSKKLVTGMLDGGLKG